MHKGRGQDSCFESNDSNQTDMDKRTNLAISKERIQPKNYSGIKKVFVSALICKQKSN